VAVGDAIRRESVLRIQRSDRRLAIRGVRPNDNGSTTGRPPLQNFDPQMPLPQEFRRPDLCDIPTLDALGDDINEWHGDVHIAVGGTMRDPAVSPAAPIFWCWHAFIDDVDLDWETCP
jgi:Common central domain of tyrosinase